MIIKNHESISGHWYTPEGVAVHSVPNKSKPGTYRSTTIKDARGAYFPSVTGILGVIAKPQLVQWMCEQSILSALTLPRDRGEIDDDFARRVIEDSKAQAKQAAETGSALHQMAEQYLTNGEIIERSTKLLELFQPIKEYLSENVLEVHFAEKVLVNKEQGYAGTCDLFCTLKGIGPAVCDFKGQKYREDKKGIFAPLFYDEWPLQLMAYRQCLRRTEGIAMRQPDIQLVSVPFCYEKPAKIQHKVWPIEDQDKYWEAFKAAHTLWKYIKKW